MGAWYTIGFFAGLGAAFGVVAAGILPRVAFAAATAAVAAIALALGLYGWEQAVGGGGGGVLGGLGASPIVAGALRRGGTRPGTALLIGVAGIVAAGLAFIPGVGYGEGIVVALLGLRRRRREPQRHAGLRTLARD